MLLHQQKVVIACCFGAVSNGVLCNWGGSQIWLNEVLIDVTVARNEVRGMKVFLAALLPVFNGRGCLLFRFKLIRIPKNFMALLAGFIDTATNLNQGIGISGINSGE